MAILSVTKLVL